MGTFVERDRFTEAEVATFQRRLHENLRALRELLERPGFGVGPESIGAELESSIVDASGCALSVNEAVFDRCEDPRVQLELMGFNIEYNLTPVPTAGSSLSALERELEAAMQSLEQACAAEQGRLAPVGILPTLRPEDLRADVITERPRYRALQNGMAQVQPFPVRLDINGADERLQVECESLAYEGSNTSFQLHLRVDPDRFADTYNAAQLAIPLAVAIGANSPIFLERLLWDETRVPLFKQTFIGRQPPSKEWRPAVRVPFGHGWVRRGIREVLAEAVALHPPVLAVSEDEDSVAMVRAGGVPQLAELRLHQGTIWQWNRAIYDPSAGGHVRVEFRALPSGPTPVDMIATAAFLFGLVAALREDVDALLPAFPFRYAEHNFYRAAKHGLDATLLWPVARPPSPAERPILELIDELMPRADEGLDRLGVDATDRARYLGIIQERRQALTTGARWLRRSLLRLDAHHARRDALQHLTQVYLANVQNRRPVHAWSDVDP